MTPSQARGARAGGDGSWRMRMELACRTCHQLAQANPVSAAAMVDSSLTLARCAAAIDARAEVADGLRQAAIWAAAALNTATGSLPLSPALAQGGLCAAVVLRHSASLAVLAAPGAYEANCMCFEHGASGVGHEAFWPCYGGLFATAARGERPEITSLCACRTAIRCCGDTVIDQAGLLALKLPPLALLEVLFGGNSQAWSATLEGALAAFETFFNASDWVTLELGMLALDIAALCAIAHDRDWPMAAGVSPFLPAWLVVAAAY